jgi:hypothetical protein
MKRALTSFFFATRLDRIMRDDLIELGSVGLLAVTLSGTSGWMARSTISIVNIIEVVVDASNLSLNHVLDYLVAMQAARKMGVFYPHAYLADNEINLLRTNGNLLVRNAFCTL